MYVLGMARLSPNRSDRPQMGQIWDFLRSVSVDFGSVSQNVLKLILKRPRFVPFGTNLTQLEGNPDSTGWGCLRYDFSMYWVSPLTHSQISHFRHGDTVPCRVPGHVISHLSDSRSTTTKRLKSTPKVYTTTLKYTTQYLELNAGE